MSRKQQQAQIDADSKLCICPTCPSSVGTGETELLFCVQGKSQVLTVDKGCVCLDCPVTPRLRLRWKDYCFKGSGAERLRPEAKPSPVLSSGGSQNRGVRHHREAASRHDRASLCAQHWSRPDMWIDLTLKIPPDHPVRKRFDDPGRELLRAGHLGTHLDRHLGTTIPLDYVVSRGVLVNVAHLDDGHVGLAELAQVDLEPGDFLILHSGRVARLGYGTAEYLQGGVRLADEVIDDLLQKGIHFIGIDGPGIRQGLEHTPADKRCESAGVYVIENLDSVTWLFENLRARGQQLLTVYTMWWEVKGSGIPCRVIAALDEA